MLETTKELLDNRGAVYGPFKDGILTETKIIEAMIDMHVATHGEPPPVETVVKWTKIAMKLSRIAASPGHVDSWRDISGYAELIGETYASS